MCLSIGMIASILVVHQLHSTRAYQRRHLTSSKITSYQPPSTITIDPDRTPSIDLYHLDRVLPTLHGQSSSSPSSSTLT
jgi:hypothetical protein